MSEQASARRSAALGWIVFFGCAIGVIILGLLLTSVGERRAERSAYLRMLVPLSEFEADNTKWGTSFPREFDSWQLTRNSEERTKYGGSAPRDYLEASPSLVLMWAGYPFAKGYNQARGHYNALLDVTRTPRVNEKTPGTCWTCKSPDVPRIMSRVGPEKFYSAHFSDWKGEIKNPIGCSDCHDPKTMGLRITRPALIEAFKRQGKDVRKASHQEMRSLVCAQCHVEYYFKDKKTNYLIFPWDKGFRADDIDAYYQGTTHSDWTHAISGAKMLKMQHPDYEIWNQGIHAYRNVSCADCHMPYKSEGGIKFTDHQVRSPLLNVSNSCQVCHRWSELEVKRRVESIQDKTRELLDICERNITLAHLEIADAMKLKASDQDLEPVRKTVARAQMYWDYVAAGNGMGLHAPQETARVLAKSNDLAMNCRLETARIRANHGATGPISLPDISTKAEAQAFIKPFLPAEPAKPSVPTGTSSAPATTSP